APARPSPPPADDGVRLVRVPVPPMVRHPLALQRALRPLKRRVPSPNGQVLDEEATAHRIARLNARPDGWLPVMRPAKERWLRLCLVYDTGTTMPMWRPLVHELHTTFAQSGVFRTVELHRARPDGTVPAQAAAASADGRTVTLLISDCMGPQWREGATGDRWYRTLRRWAEHMPLAVVQPLPERLWHTTALPTAPGLLSAPCAAAPSGALSFTPYDAARRPPDDAVPLPVLEPGAAWLSHWASLVADPGGAWFPAAVGWVGRSPAPPDPEEHEDVALLSAESVVLRFRSTASPEAFRLAGHLAMGTPHLPVMRLVHAAVEEHPRPQHLAEVILSGMLTGVPDGPPGAYAFRDGVRDVLLRSLPRTARGRTRQFLAQVGGLIDDRAGAAPGELRAGARVGRDRPHRADGADEPPLEAEPFATVSQESARRLGGVSGLLAGRYRLDGPAGAEPSLWLARDSWQGDESVLVRTYPRPEQWLKEAFSGLAHRLTQVRHPNVAAVRDYGVEDETPYLVHDFVEGRTLDRLTGRSPDRLPDSDLLPLVAPLAATVTALHAEGIAHGAVRPSNVVVTPLGPLLTGLDVKAFDATSREEDLRDLGHLIRVMYGGTWYPASRHLTMNLAGLNLSDEMQWSLRDAVSGLLSDGPEAQRRGAARLARLDPEPEYDRRYSLLGPLAVSHDGRPLATGSGQEQALLCMLLLRERGVTYNELIDGLWGSAAPKDARRLIDAYASRLRNALGPDSVRAAGSHALLLQSDADDVDLFRCRKLAAHAVEARSDGDIEGAFRLVQNALDLWYGEPLDGVPGPAADAARADIRALRQSLVRMQRELAQPQQESGPDAAELDELLQEFPHADDERLAPHEAHPAVDLAALDTAQNEPDAPPARTFLAFDSTARDTPASALRDLGEVVSRFLVQGGIGPERFALSPRARGWDVTVAPEVHALQVLTVVLRELPRALMELAPFGVAVTLTRDPDRTPPVVELPAERARLLSGTSTRQAVVIVSDDLHDDLVRSGRFGTVRFERVPQSDDWYHSIAFGSSLAAPSAVLLGFDGTLTRLFPGKASSDAARRLALLAVERRDVDSALSGEAAPPGAPGGPTSENPGTYHPLDVLRAYEQADDERIAHEMSVLLEELETRAAEAARPLPHSSTLLRSLTRSRIGARVAVVTDVSPRAVSAYMEAHGLPSPRGGIHGRDHDRLRLLPAADCLSRALERLDTPPDRCLMVGALAQEATAAGALGIPFIGFAGDDRRRERLLDAGALRTVSSLSELAGLADHTA
ncbi:SAV_2336 N-terminal domain-related protein, partial [Streptomyces luteocolor]|uniref:SAV_2336 N-terminal domain-related protein n=1 Tax=Streptomyces luteocolor TaxID=285500 RepID=UPI0022A94166